MKINDQNMTGLSSTQLGRTQETEALGRPGRGNLGKAGAGGGDQVQLSSLAGSLRELSADSPEREAHLEKLAALVEAGQYQVDASALSKKMVDESLRERGQGG